MYNSFNVDTRKNIIPRMSSLRIVGCFVLTWIEVEVEIHLDFDKQAASKPTGWLLVPTDRRMLFELREYKPGASALDDLSKSIWKVCFVLSDNLCWC